jgi:hypothetical protein
MDNPQVLPPATIRWLMVQALNELNAYLCEGDPYEENGAEWPMIARENSAHCRAIAAVATRPTEKREWLELANQYEGTI